MYVCMYVCVYVCVYVTSDMPLKYSNDYCTRTLNLSIYSNDYCTRTLNLSIYTCVCKNTCQHV
jgi:hypothetical protein